MSETFVINDVQNGTTVPIREATDAQLAKALAGAEAEHQRLLEHISTVVDQLHQVAMARGVFAYETDRRKQGGIILAGSVGKFLS